MKTLSLLLALVLLRAAAPVPAAADDDEGGGGSLFGAAFKHAASKVGGALGQTATEKLGGRVNVTSEDVESVKQAAKAVHSGTREIGEQEEYYLGRSVAARVLAKYPAVEDEALNRYVQAVAQAVALSSERPEIAKGYHVQVLKSDDVNALSTPGGFLFVTTGLLRAVDSEDQLAAVLAHELAHVAKKHGLKTIKAARLTQAFEIMGGAAARKYSRRDLTQLTDLFGGAVDDVAKTVVTTGYGRDNELEADRVGAEMAARANYDPTALSRFLESAGGGHGGMFKTHPASSQRVKQLAGLDLPPSSEYAESDARVKRFAAAQKRLK